MDLNAAHHITYDPQNEHAGAYATNIKTISGSYKFDVVMKDEQMSAWQLNDVVLNYVTRTITMRLPFR